MYVFSIIKMFCGSFVNKNRIMIVNNIFVVFECFDSCKLLVLDICKILCFWWILMWML